MTSLADELARLRAEVLRTYPEEANLAFAAAIDELRMRQVADHGLATGDVFPDFALPDDSGQCIESAALIGERPLVVAFFRGTWCPYCRVALRFLESARHEIEAAGAHLVAIAPDTPRHLREARAEVGPGLTLLSDPDVAFARLCGLDYEVPDLLVDFFIRAGIDLPDRHGRDGWSLPLPASFVIDREGRVAFAAADPDWRFRAEPADLIAALRHLPG